MSTSVPNLKADPSLKSVSSSRIDVNASDNIPKVKENTIKNNKGDLSADVNSSDDE